MQSNSMVIFQVATDDLEGMIQRAVDAALVGHRITTTPEPDSRYLTGEDVCTRLHISKMTLHNWRKSGKLTSYKIGRRVLYLMADVEAAMTADVPLKYRRR